MFSVTDLITDKLTPSRDTLELSAEVRTLTVSIRRATAPTQETSKEEIIQTKMEANQKRKH